MEALQRIAARLETLEREVIDRSEGPAVSELARRLDEIPRAIGEEVRTALLSTGEWPESRVRPAAG